MSMRVAVAALAFVTFALPALAQEGTAERLRGTIDAINGDTLSITTTQGEKIDLALTGETRFSTLEKRSMSDIGPGTFLASAGEKRDDGKLYAVEIRIFGQGGNARQFEYDLGPGSMMTNAPVAQVASVDNGNVVKVTLPEGEVEYIIPADLVIGEQVAADRGALAPGKYAVVNGRKMPDGSHVANSVLVEGEGVKPGN